MSGTLKEITENYEKLHRLQMIDTILGTIRGYTREMTSQIEDKFDYCDDSEEFEAIKDSIESVIDKVKDDMAILDSYL